MAFNIKTYFALRLRSPVGGSERFVISSFIGCAFIGTVFCVSINRVSAAARPIRPAPPATAPTTAPTAAPSADARQTLLREKAELSRVIEERIYIAKNALRHHETTGDVIRSLNRDLAASKKVTIEQLAPFLADRDAKNAERLKAYKPHFGTLENAARTIAGDLLHRGNVEAATRLGDEVDTVREDSQKLQYRVAYRFRFVTKGGLVRQHDGYIAFHDTPDGLNDPLEVDVDGIGLFPVSEWYDLRAWGVDVRNGVLGVYQH